MKPIANLDTFLQLANILTILLCGIAIALTSQRSVQQNQDHIALMRCMGASRQQILRAYLALLAAVFAIAMLIGSLFGHFACMWMRTVRAGGDGGTIT